jgi:hypothetical protein
MSAATMSAPIASKIPPGPDSADDASTATSRRSARLRRAPRRKRARLRSRSPCGVRRDSRPPSAIPEEPTSESVAVDGPAGHFHLQPQPRRPALVRVRLVLSDVALVPALDHLVPPDDADTCLEHRRWQVAGGRHRRIAKSATSGRSVSGVQLEWRSRGRTTRVEVAKGRKARRQIITAIWVVARVRIAHIPACIKGLRAERGD